MTPLSNFSISSYATVCTMPNFNMLLRLPSPHFT